MVIENSPLALFLSQHLEYKRLACVAEFPHQTSHTNTQTQPPPPTAFHFHTVHVFFSQCPICASEWSGDTTPDRWECCVLYLTNENAVFCNSPSQSVPDSPENDDANIKKIAREVLENRAYVCSHPLERTYWALQCNHNAVSPLFCLDNMDESNSVLMIADIFWLSLTLFVH